MMDRKALLQEVNKLVSSGLRQSAIDLINEYLEVIPNDPSVLGALGRIYLLENKPDQAVKYLQLSLSSRKAEQTASDHVISYSVDALDHEDLDYIDNASIEDEEEYFYGSEEVTQSSVSSAEPPRENPEKQIVEPIANQEIRLTDDSRSIDANEEFSGSAAKDSYSLKPEFIAPSSPQISGSENDFSDHQTDAVDETFDDDLELFSDLDDEIEQEDEDIEEIFGNDEEKSIEDEFDWDGVEDFEDIDEADAFRYLQDHQVTTHGKVSRIERAKQIAIEVIQTYDWGNHNLDLLQLVFYENGWGAARVAIEHELARGLTPTELELAIFIKRLWTENEQYWISFLHIKTKMPAQITRAAYKNMSWREALRVIRVFNTPPSEEEIQLFIDDIYDDWYCSTHLQKVFKTFIRYLKYRTGSVRHTLPANEQFSFIPAYEQDYLIDLSRDEIKYTRDVEALKQQGIDLESMLQDLEQEYEIVKPYIKDEENFYLMDGQDE